MPEQILNPHFFFPQMMLKSIIQAQPQKIRTKYGTGTVNPEPGAIGEMYTRKVQTAGSYIVYMKFDISSIDITGLMQLLQIYG